MQHPKSRIAVDGKTITVYASPKDTRPMDLSFKNTDAARTAKTKIEAARDPRNITQDTPLYAAVLTWMWWGTSALHDDTRQKYRSAIRHVFEMAGGTRMVDVDRDWYGRLHDAMTTKRTSIGIVEGVETMLGSWASWCDDSPAWTGPRPTGNNHYSLHKSARAEARAVTAGSGGGETDLIKMKDCPTIDLAIAFGQTLGDVAARWWGEGYRCWENAPLIQFSTGARVGELPVLRDTDFDLSELSDAIVRIQHQYRDGRTEPGKPNVGPTKDKQKRRAHVWSWSGEMLVPIVATAAENPGGLLLPLPPTLVGGKRRLQALYETAVAEHGYGWTSHGHRQAYISYNLATPAEGGYGFSMRRVADWVGHTKTDLIAERYWVPVATDYAQSHKPGDAQR